MNHKIAILSDIHGNTTALEAVIADAKNQGVSEYWLLGDIFLPGPGANDLVVWEIFFFLVQVQMTWSPC